MLGDKPLIAYTIESGLAAKGLDKLIVSTDAVAIRNIAEELGALVPFLRPAHLAQDDSPALALIQHALDFLEERGETFDAVCLLQPTTPFRPAGFIDAAIARFVQSEADSLISVVPVPTKYNPHWVFEPNVGGYLTLATGEANPIPRRQELPPAFIRDGALYLTRVSVIRNHTLYGERISWICDPQMIAVNIDTPSDWEEAQQQVSRYQASLCAELPE